mmetsp:Transcript_54930/g.172317  ORF Transcript_54930/g.172317 Transcript_54930/m.172317 type:complete len:534 (+) Transcript_54930:50-1651(+)
MMVDPIVRAAVTAALLALVFVAAALSLWRALHTGSIAAGLGRLLAWLRHEEGGDRVDAIDCRVAQMCRERRLERARAAALFGIVLAAAAEWWLFMKQVHYSEFIAVSLQVFMAALANLFPRCLTLATVDAIFCVALLLMIMVVVLTGRDMYYDSCGYAFSRIVFGSTFWCFFNLRPSLNVAGLFLLAVAWTTVMLLSSHAPHWIHAVVAFLHVGVISMLLCWIDHLLTTSVRLEIRAADSGKELAAVRTLLDSICDVIVECDSCFRLMRHSPKLSTMLLRNTGLSLQGAIVLDFMPSEADRDAFRQNMAISSDASSPSSQASVFHGKLRDANGGVIAIEFFAIAFRGPSDQQRRLLGMREFTDIQPLAALPESPPAPPRRPRRRGLRGTPPSPERADLTSSGSSSDASSEASSASGSDLPGGGPIPAAGGGGPAAAAPGLETVYAVKKLTLGGILSVWRVDSAGQACCQWHAALAEATRITTRLSATGCDQTFGPANPWQCSRCGIVDVRYRRRREGRGCRLCKAMTTAGMHL